MKKWIAMLLCLALLGTLCGCRRDNQTQQEETAPETDLQEQTEPQTAEEDAAASENADGAAEEDAAAENTAKPDDTAKPEDAAADNAESSKPSGETGKNDAADDTNADSAAKEPTAQGGKSAAEQLRSAFLEAAAEDPADSLRELAEEIADECDLPFETTVEEAKVGALAGFGDAKIEGFDEGVMVAPTVSTVPFIGYVFRAADEDAARTLLGKLEEHADLRWNVCTEAEETVKEQVGNIAFFAMTVRTFE